MVKKKEEVVKGISLDRTVIYKEVNKRIQRLLITAGALLVVGIIVMVYVILERSIFLFIVCNLVFIYSIYLFYLSFQRSEDPFKHPDLNHFLKWAEHYGDIAILMDEELKWNRKAHFSNAFFTDSFVFTPSFYRYGWFHFTEICWAYNNVTSNYTNGIPTGKDYAVNVHLDNGTLLKIKICKSEELLKHLLEIAPFAIYGYTDQLKSSWENNALNFINNVQHRKKQFFDNPKKFIEEHFE